MGGGWIVGWGRMKRWVENIGLTAENGEESVRKRGEAKGESEWHKHVIVPHPIAKKKKIATE